jgi:RNA polymerase sigma-70 factor (ECF subfamily)
MNEAAIARADLNLVRGVFLAEDAAAVDRAVARLAERLAFVPGLLRAIDRRRGQRLCAEEVEDLSQDVIVILWRKLEVYNGMGCLERWSYRVCMLEYSNLVRKRSRRCGTVPLDEVELSDEHRADAIYDDLVEQLEQALARLASQEEAIVRQKLIHESTFVEIGDRFGISPNTAKTRYYRGLARVRGFLTAGSADDEHA